MLDILEQVLHVGIIWVLGVATGWGIAYAVVIAKRKPQAPARPREIECDTCGQITSEHHEGLCAWCQRVYAKGKR